MKLQGWNPAQSTLNEWVMNVGLAFQNPFNQISGAKYTVFEEIAFGLENIGVPRDEMKARVDECHAVDWHQRSGGPLPLFIIWRTTATRRADLHPGHAAKGSRARRATSQMDPIGTREVFGVIRKMAEQGMTVVLVEHKVEWIAQFADRVIALKDGQVLLDGTPCEVLTSPILEESGFGISRYTSVARKAHGLGLWKKDRLPVTLDEAAEGFCLSPSPPRERCAVPKGNGEQQS